MEAVSLSPEVTLDVVREIVRALPGVDEGLSYGTPAFRVRKKLLARLLEDGDSMVLKTDFFQRETLMELQPETFYLTEHYMNYPLVLVRLSRVRREQLANLLETAWRPLAPKGLVELYDRKAR
jgi:hypothetical protein